MVAYTKPQKMKKEGSKRLRGEIVAIKFMDLRFERWQVARFSRARRRQDVPEMQTRWMLVHRNEHKKSVARNNMMSEKAA